MKQRLVLLLSLVVVPGVLLCRADTTAVKVEEPITVGGFQMTLTSSGNAPSGMVMVNASIKNVTDKPLNLVVSNNIGTYSIEVTDSKGEAMPRTRYGEHIKRNAGTFFGIGPTTVQPNGSYDQELPISQMFDMTEPGVYLIKVKYSVFNSKTKTTEYISSNTLSGSVLWPSLKSTPPW